MVERRQKILTFIERARSIKECLGPRVNQLIDNHDLYY